MWCFSHTWIWGIWSMFTICYCLQSVIYQSWRAPISSLVWRMKDLVHLRCLPPSLPALLPRFCWLYYYIYLFWLEIWQINSVPGIFNSNKYLLSLCYEIWEKYSLYLFCFHLSFPSLPFFFGCHYFKSLRLITFMVCSLTLISNVVGFAYILMHKPKIIKQHFHYDAYYSMQNQIGLFQAWRRKCNPVLPKHGR